MLFLKACTYSIDYTYLWSLIYLFRFFSYFFLSMYCSLFNHLSHSRFTVVYFSFELMQWLIVSLMCVNERNRNTCIVKHPSSNIWTSDKKYSKCQFYSDVIVNDLKQRWYRGRVVGWYHRDSGFKPGGQPDIVLLFTSPFHNDLLTKIYR
jgi:hypothetical protein